MKEVITPKPIISDSTHIPVIQIYALKDSSEAILTQKRISKAIGRTVAIESEGGFYKLRITGLSGKEEADILIDKLAQAGYPDAYIQNPDNFIINDNLIDEKNYSAAIQVGAFVSQENAQDVEQKLHKITDLPIFVIYENGYYKVRITGFSGRIEAIAFLPKLFKKGFSEAYVVRLKIK